MPFEKVVITHKFGIISQTHKKQLQDRLYERRTQILNAAGRSQKKDDNIINIQITEDFVKEYNEANFEKKTQLDYMCIQMFEKIKKRLISFNLTDDLNIQLAWAELSQLMQCNSPIQEECLDLFILSMEFAHLSVLQIPTLFFLAETVIYWIRTDTINQPFLRAFEIKLLKVGQLIFQRIYFYLSEENGKSQNDLKEHLAIYLQGFDEYENAYSPYPDALLYMRYIIKVGRFVTKDLTAKKTDEISEKSNQKNLYEEMKSDTQSDKSKTEDIKNKNEKELYDHITDSSDNFTLSPTMTQASVILALLNKKYQEKLLDLSLESLIECSTSLTKENWIDSYHALNIIGECSKINLKALNSFLLISNSTLSSYAYDLSRSISNSSQNEETCSETSFLSSNKKNGIETWQWELGCTYADILGEICINGSQSFLKKKALLGFNKDSKQALNQKKKQLKGYGLLDLTRFQLKLKQNEEDLSWKIRYSAIKALVSICKAINDKNNEEFRQTCWASLVVCQENETNNNVLEAIKVGQIASKTEEFSSKKGNKKASSNYLKQNLDYPNIYSQMSRRINDSIMAYELQKENEALSSENSCSKKNRQKSDSSTEDTELKSYRLENLPIDKLTDDNKWSTTSKEQISESPRETFKKAGNGKKRLTLREEIKLSEQFEKKIPNYDSRKSVNLMRIVEDQYRKEEKQKFENNLKNFI